MNGREVEAEKVMQEVERLLEKAAQHAARRWYCETCKQFFGKESDLSDHTLTASHQRVLQVESRQKAAGESSSGGSQNPSDGGIEPWYRAFVNPIPHHLAQNGNYILSIVRENVVGKFVNLDDYTPSKKENLYLLEELKFETDVEKKVAKAAFKSLLEFAKVEPDWTWDRAMNAIIIVDWYQAHLSIQERKDAFNEYQGQRKVQNIEGIFDEMKWGFEKSRAKVEERATKIIKELRDVDSNQQMSGIQYELKALDMAGSWAKDEAIRVKGRAKVLEDARRRSEMLEGIKVIVDNDLCDDANVGPTWVTDQTQLLIEQTKSRAEDLVDKLKAMATDVKGETIDMVIQNIVFLISQLKKWE